MSKTVLLVDDSVTQSFHLKLALVRAGFKVVTAADGRSALKHLDSEKADVVLADVIMPMMDGYELCRQIKDSPKHGKLPVILMSGFSEEDSVHRFRGHELTGFIPKPFERATLIARLDAVVAGAKA